jgi:hypothetical protein
MLGERAILALLAVQALSALAKPIGPFTVQDPDVHIALDPMCDATETTGALPLGPPEVHLDDGVFVGNRILHTDQFLGIPFALPP